MNNILFYRRALPHYQATDAIYFVTFRLDGSLPKETIVRLQQEREQEERCTDSIADVDDRAIQCYDIQKKYFGKFDDLLDGSASGPLWLGDERIAQIVVDVVFRRHGIDYELYAYCVMPNHVHVLLSLIARAKAHDTSKYILANTLHLIKGSSAYEANKVLCRKGRFWQHESYDHIVRNESELIRIIKYVMNNPVKARLVDRPEDWEWSYCDKSLLCEL